MFTTSQTFSNYTCIIICAVSDFLYEEFSAMPIRAKITFMLFPMRIFLLILIVLLRIKIRDKLQTLRLRSPISSVG